MAVIIRLNETFSGADVDRLPVIHEVDPIEADGSLILVDMNHAYYENSLNFTAGETVPNLLNKPSLLDLPAFAATLTNLPNAKITLEKTEKNGIHFIAKPGILDASLPVGFSLDFSYNKLRDYLKSATGHEMYYSWWGRVTRGMTYSGGLGRAHFTAGNGAGDFLLGVVSRGNGETNNQMDAAVYGNRIFGSNHLSSAGALRSYQTGTVADMTSFSASNLGASIFAGGSQSGGPNYFDKNAEQTYPSIIFYRFYAEDLTVSGRDYAAIAALDAALYNKECLTEGGRFHGDSWTEPETLD